jgi:hypothetical protein
MDIEGFVGVFYFLGVKAHEEMARERLRYLESVKYVDSITTSINLIKHHHYYPHHNYQHTSANVASTSGTQVKVVEPSVGRLAN